MDAHSYHACTWLLALMNLLHWVGVCAWVVCPYIQCGDIVIIIVECAECKLSISRPTTFHYSVHTFMIIVYSCTVGDEHVQF